VVVGVGGKPTFQANAHGDRLYVVLRARRGDRQPADAHPSDVDSVGGARRIPDSIRRQREAV